MGIIEAIKKIEREEGMEEGLEKGVTNLLKTKRFTISEIANFMNVSEAFVKKVKRKVKK